MVMAAMAWCDGYTAPLLVPLNGWLQPPLPLQIRALTCPQGVKLIEAAPSGQHVVVVPSQGDDAQLWHVMSGQLVHTFKGRDRTKDVLVSFSRVSLCVACFCARQFLSRRLRGVSARYN